MRSNAPPAAKSSSSSEISMRRCSPPSKCRRPTGSPIEFCWGAARAAADGSYPWRRPFCSPLGWLPSGRASGPPISSGWKRSRTWPTSRGHSRLSTRCRAVFSSRCFPSRAWRPCVRWGKSSTCAYARWPVNGAPPGPAHIRRTRDDLPAARLPRCASPIGYARRRHGGDRHSRRSRGARDRRGEPGPRARLDEVVSSELTSGSLAKPRISAPAPENDSFVIAAWACGKASQVEWCCAGNGRFRSGQDTVQHRRKQ